MLASSSAEDSGVSLFLTVEDDQLEAHEEAYGSLQTDISALQQA